MAWAPFQPFQLGNEASSASGKHELNLNCTSRSISSIRCINSTEADKMTTMHPQLDFELSKVPSQTDSLSLAGELDSFLYTVQFIAHSCG